MKMGAHLSQIKTEVYDPCGLKLSDFKTEQESQEYNACSYRLNGLHIIHRNAKVTPKKVGQFVTFWKRINKGPIEPFQEADPIHFYTVNVQTETELGQFVFPRAVLIRRGIISTEKKEGKRAFRVYPNWDQPKNKQAERTQNWQLQYFYNIDKALDLKKVVVLYKQD